MSASGSKSVEGRVKEVAFKHALLNAVKHGGKAQLGPVVSKVVGELPEIRGRVKEYIPIIKQAVDEVNKLSLDEQRRILEEKWPEALQERKVEEEKKLPPLPNVEKYKVVVTRFAPNPDFYLTLGNARPAILSHEYAEMYKGYMILRFEDTDPKIKRPMLEAYDAIKEDLAWLGVKWKEEHVQSLRMKIYYDIARQLLEKGAAYVDLCKPEDFRAYRDQGKPCPHRNQAPEDNLELWDKMVSGELGEGEAVVRIKTDLSHPDPAVRDWVAFRIIDTSKKPHPLVGDRYVVWPTYNFAAGVDDHLLGVTHILRAREHYTNTIKQKFLYDHLGWEYPETIHFGRLKLEGLVLSKSQIRKALTESPEEYDGVADPRFGTLRALRERGILPETIRQVIIEVGVKPSDASISYDNIAAINRKFLDKAADRYMAVKEPLRLRIEGLPKDAKARIPVNPAVPSKGHRELTLSSNEVLVQRSDVREGAVVRLMGLCNVRIERIGNDLAIGEIAGFTVDEAKKYGAQIIQWVPSDYHVQVFVRKVVVGHLVVEELLGEPHLSKLRGSEVIQLIRYGFVKVKNVTADGVVCVYAHE